MVLSCREFRASLAETLKKVQEPDAEPVFVGAHRRPEAVVLSVAQYEQLMAGRRRDAVEQALASVRLEGLELAGADRDRFAQVAAGELSFEELRAQVLARYPA